jgi:AcrR family transcriptional regulator
MTTAEVRRRTGGRSARVRDAVLRAALEAMAETGPTSVTFSEIARRAGVHATSIQRRWGSCENVLLDALLSYSEQTLPIPDTGSLRDDLVSFGRSIAAYLATPLGESVARTMAALADDETIATNRTRFWQTRYEIARVIVDRAMARGEVDEDADPELALELLVAPLHFRKVMTRQPVDDTFVERMVDILMRGLLR